MRTIKKYNWIKSVSVFCLVLVVFLIPLSARAVQNPKVLVAWCPTSTPTASTSQAPTSYITPNSAATLMRSNGGNISGAGSGTSPEATQYSYNSTGWNTSSQWWQLSSISTVGFENIQLSFFARGSATGPRNFALQYSTNGTDWFDITDSGGSPATYIVNADNNFHQVGPFILSAVASDSANLLIRFLNTDTQPVGAGTTTGSTGVNNLSDIIITGTPITDDGRTMVSEWFITLDNADDNHAYYVDNPTEKPQFEATGGVYSSTSTYWVEKNTANQLHPINTSLTGEHALYAGGVRYLGLNLGSFCIIETSSAGYEDIEVSWAMRCSNTAPANYQIEYSVDYDPGDAGNATWTSLGPNVVLTQDIPIFFPQAHYTRTLPDGADNQQKLFIRLYVPNNISIQGGASNPNGVFSINDIIVTGKALSDDAGLTSVSGQPILAGSEAGTDAAPKTASISVDNSVASVELADIIASDANAEVELYSDSGFTTPVSPVNLTEGGTTHLYIKATAEDGTELYYDVSVNRAALTYALTVVDGTDDTGGSPYVTGATVSISAKAAPAGEVFDKWVSSSGGSFADASSTSTTFTMPANPASVTATYKLAPIITDASISPTTAVFDKNSARVEYKDILITLTPGSYAFSEIMNDTYPLQVGTDYTVSDDVYTIKKEYLTTLPSGAVTLTFDMSGGTDPTLALTVADTAAPLVAPVITSANSYILIAGKAGSFQMTATGNPAPTFYFGGTIPAGVSIDPSTGFITFTNSVEAGTYIFTVGASNGVGTPASQTFTLTVNTTTYPQTGDDSNMLNWLVALLVSALGCLLILVWRKQRQIKGTW